MGVSDGPEIRAQTWQAVLSVVSNSHFDSAGSLIHKRACRSERALITVRIGRFTEFPVAADNQGVVREGQNTSGDVSTASMFGI
jgi:hypothetical protein